MNSQIHRLASVILASALSMQGVLAATYTVANANDAGAGSLRQAILDANANCLSDAAPVIRFDIGGQSSRVIRLATSLPTFDCGAAPYSPTLNGESQPGAAANTDPHAFTAALRVVIDGTDVPAVCGLAYRFYIHPYAGSPLFGPGSGFLTVRGLEVRNFGDREGSRWAIGICGKVRVFGNRIVGNNIGVYPGNASVIGDASPADRNVISGNRRAGLRFGDEYPRDSDNVSIVNNLIGTDDSGRLAMPNGFGMEFFSISNARIEGNVISGNEWGLYVADATQVSIIRNVIGEDVAGAALPNSLDGVHVSGSTRVMLEENRIRHNGDSGIHLMFSDVTVRGGVIDSNGDGIEMRPLFFPTPTSPTGSAHLTLDFGEVRVGEASTVREVGASSHHSEAPVQCDLRSGEGCPRPGEPVVPYYSPPLLRLRGFSASPSCEGQPICADGAFACEASCTSYDDRRTPAFEDDCALKASFVPKQAGAFSSTFYLCTSLGNHAITLQGNGVRPVVVDPPPPTLPADRRVPPGSPGGR